MSASVDVSGILERAGANPDAPEGSQAWALAQVNAAVAELVERTRALESTHKAFRAWSATAPKDAPAPRSLLQRYANAKEMLFAAIARVGGAK